MSSSRVLNGEPRPKGRRILTQKALKGDELPETYFTTPLSPPSPAERPYVRIKSAGNPVVNHIIELDRPWERQSIDLQTAIVAPTAAWSKIATVPIADVAREDSHFDSRFIDDYHAVKRRKSA